MVSIDFDRIANKDKTAEGSAILYISTTLKFEFI